MGLFDLVGAREREGLAEVDKHFQNGGQRRMP